jgi:hypothetical protein
MSYDDYDDNDDQTKRIVLWKGQEIREEKNTDRAFCIYMGDNPAGSKFKEKLIWLPKSTCSVYPSDADPQKYDIRLPYWLAEKHDLEDDIEEDV